MGDAQSARLAIEKSLARRSVHPGLPHGSVPSQPTMPAPGCSLLDEYSTNAGALYTGTQTPIDDVFRRPFPDRQKTLPPPHSGRLRATSRYAVRARKGWGPWRPPHQGRPTQLHRSNDLGHLARITWIQEGELRRTRGFLKPLKSKAVHRVIHEHQSASVACKAKGVGLATARHLSCRMSTQERRNFRLNSGQGRSRAFSPNKAADAAWKGPDWRNGTTVSFDMGVYSAAGRALRTNPFQPSTLPSSTYPVHQLGDVTPRRRKSIFPGRSCYQA